MGVFKDLMVTGVIRCLSKIYAPEFVGKLTGTADSAKTLSGLTSTIAELNYTDGVTSNIQSQLNTLTNNKLNNENGRIETLTDFFTQCNRVGLWGISEINADYATSIKLYRNVGDFYYLCTSYNGDGYATGILFSPRFHRDEFYNVHIWDKVTSVGRISNDVMDLGDVDTADPYVSLEDEVLRHGFTFNRNEFTASQAFNTDTNILYRLQLDTHGWVGVHQWNRSTNTWGWVKTISPGNGYSSPSTIQEYAPGDTVCLWAW